MTDSPMDARRKLSLLRNRAPYELLRHGPRRKIRLGNELNGRNIVEFSDNKLEY
jgi:hypothetical protein